MSDDSKGQLEAPEVALPAAIAEAAPEKPYGDDVRKAIEEQAVTKNAEIPTFEESEGTEATPAPAKDKAEVEPTQEEPASHTERVRKALLKRIDKITAKAKTLEEQLAEKDAEIERLRQGVVEKPVENPVATEKREPTMEECRKALAKAYSDGDFEFAAQVTEYMAEQKAKAERVAAERAIEERATKQTQAQQKQQADWVALNRDYEVVDESGKTDLSHDMTLANQNGLLYQTALGLFKDPALKAKYAVGDTIMGFRIAVNDAYRGLIEQGHYQPVKKVVEAPAKKANVKAQLAVPDADGSGEPVSAPSVTMSDAEKAIQEIKERTSYLNKRMAF